MNERSELIVRIAGWLERSIEHELNSAAPDAERLLPMIDSLTRLYSIQQASVRMARAQKLMDEAREEFKA